MQQLMAFVQQQCAVQVRSIQLNEQFRYAAKCVQHVSASTEMHAS